MSRELVLAQNIVERLKDELDVVLEQEDYTRLVEISDEILGNDDEAEELYGLVEGITEDDEDESDEDSFLDDLGDIDFGDEEDFDEEDLDEDDDEVEDDDEEE